MKNKIYGHDNWLEEVEFQFGGKVKYDFRSHILYAKIGNKTIGEFNETTYVGWALENEQR